MSREQKVNNFGVSFGLSGWEARQHLSD